MSLAKSIAGSVGLGQVGFVSFEVDDSVVVTGVFANGLVGSVRIGGWSVVNDAQTANWAVVNDAQANNWVVVDDSQ